MNKLFFLSILFAIGSLHSQSDQEGKEVLTSFGELPFFLEEYETRYFIPEKETWIKGIKKDKKSFYLDLVYSSNMVVYGDPVSEYCTKLLRKYTGDKQNVYVVRSNQVATFSDNELLFVTTGLIARLSNEAQLLFFLAREVELSKSGREPLFENGIKRKSLDFAINELSSFSIDIDLEIDSKVLSGLNTKGFFESEEIKSFSEVLMFKNRPFYEYKFDISYFNSDIAYVPESQYFLLRKANPKPYSYENEFPLLKKRIEQFGEEKMQSQVDKTFIIKENEFIEIVSLCRLESVRLRLLHADFPSAIYEIYILEKLGLTSPYLNRLKATSWWGLVKQDVGEIDKKKYTHYESSDSEGALFMRYVRMQSRVEKIAMGLRIIADIKNKNPESKSVDRMLNDITRIAARAEKFKIKAFHEKSLRETLEELNSGDTTIESEKLLLNIEAQALKASGVDSINYYYFLIPDLIKSEKFISLFNAYKREEIEQEKKPVNSIAIIDFDIRRYKSKKVKQIQNSQEIAQTSISIANDKTDVNVSFNNSSNDYNLSHLINTVFIQNYWYSNYRKDEHSVFSDDIAKLSNHINQDALGIFTYEHAYEPRYRPFHLIGLAVVTLPYVIPEIFFSGNKSVNGFLAFDSITGETIQMINHSFKDPFNERIIHQLFLEVTTNLTND